MLAKATAMLKRISFESREARGSSLFLCVQICKRYKKQLHNNFYCLATVGKNSKKSSILWTRRASEASSLNQNSFVVFFKLLVCGNTFWPEWKHCELKYCSLRSKDYRMRHFDWFFKHGAYSLLWGKSSKCREHDKCQNLGSWSSTSGRQSNKLFNVKPTINSSSYKARHEARSVAA